MLSSRNRKMLLWIAAFDLLVVILIFGFLARFPNAGEPPAIVASQDSQVIARGEYLANNVTVCIDCHSQRDWQRFSGPIVDGTQGQGGERFTHEFGFPGEFIAANITPKGIGEWSDAQLAHVITTGVKRDGQAIFPVMPYPSYRKLCREDLVALVSYIRTLVPVENSVERSTIDFPENVLMRLMPQPYVMQECPPPQLSVTYGKYLTTIAGCEECHTPSEKGSKLPGLDFAGGFEFTLPQGIVRSSNLTPDPRTGIGSWDADQFVARFATYRQPVEKVEPGMMQTVMPWTMYAQMSDDDLRAIFAYLKTTVAVERDVERWTAKP